MSDPDLIYINVEEKVETAANRCDLFVRIEGSSFWTGREAFKKAKEVVQLVAELADAGLESSDIELQGVRAETKKAVTNSSSADYNLKIRCSDLTSLPGVVAVVTSQKNVTLNGVDWGYEEDDEQEAAILRRSLDRAKKKAAIVAQSLGVTIQGIHAFTDEWVHDDGRRPIAVASAIAKGGLADYMASLKDLGMEVYHTRKSKLRVKVKFRISELARE